MSAIDNKDYDLAKVALGEMKADLAIVNGDVVNVYTGEALKGDTVLIKGEKIAYVGKNARRSIGADTKIIDASGKTLIPGLIDGHVHEDKFYSSGELAKYAIKGGTNSIITETIEVGFALGYDGIVEFIKSLQNQPVKFWITAPSMVTISPTAEKYALTADEMRRLLRRKEVIGMGEPYWAPTIAGSQRILDYIAEAKKAGKRIEGHSAGAAGNKLQAYASLGVSSCHEPITAEEVMERLRLGMFIMAREGEIRRDLEAISHLKDRLLDSRLLAVGTDGIGPEQLTTDGYMDFVVQKAINLGFPPIRAIQMATINIAQHFNLDGSIGGIAPGRYADILIIPDLTTIRAEYVISNGQVVAKDGELLGAPRKHKYPKSVQNSVHLDRDFKAEDFAVAADTGSSNIRVRVIDQVTNLVTREALVDLPVINDKVQMDIAGGVIKVASIERTHQTGKMFTGFVRGIGLKRGAIATFTYDSSNIIVVGAREADMALAVNRFKELGGGIIVCRDGVIIAELALPIGGVISLEPMETIAQKLHNIQQAAESLGVIFPSMRITLSFLSAAAIPHLRICEQGLFNLRLNSFVDLIVEQ